MSGKVGDIDWEACERCKHMDERGCDQVREDEEIIEIDHDAMTVVCTKFEERQPAAPAAKE